MKNNPWRYIDEPLKEKVKKNTFTNVLQFALTFPLMFIITPMIIKYTGKEAFGIWAITGSILVFLEYLSLQTPTAVGIDVPKYDLKKDSLKVNEIANTMFVFYLAAALTAWAAFLLLKQPVLSVFYREVSPALIPDAVFVLTVSTGLYLVNFTLTSFGYLTGGFNIFYPCNILHIITGYIRVALMAWSLYAGHGIRGIVLVQMSTIIAESLALMIWLKIIYPPLSFNPALFRMKTLKRMAGLGIKLIFIRISSTVAYASDKLILGFFTGPVAVAYYQLGFGVSKYISMLPEILGTATLVPSASKLGQEEGKKLLFGIFDRMTKHIFIAGVFIAAGIIFFGREFTLLWLGKGFDDAYMVMAVLAAVYCIGAAVAPMQQVMNGMEKIKRLMVLTGSAAASNVILSAVLTSMYGIKGALAAAAVTVTASSLLTAVLFTSETGHKFNPVKMLFKPLISALAACGALYVAELFIDFHQGWAVFAFKCIVFGLIYLAAEVFVLRDIDSYDLSVMAAFFKRKEKGGA